MSAALDSMDLDFGFASVHIDKKTRDLSVANANLTDADIEQLCSLVEQSGVRTLNLSNNHIRDDGAKCLAKLSNTKLRRLVLDNNEISQAGAIYLIRSRIENISIRSNLVSNETFQMAHKEYLEAERPAIIRKLEAWAKKFKLKV